jgi:hypothetical protein
MQKLLFLSVFLFVLSAHSSAQWMLGAEYKYHPRENQLGIRYDGLSNLTSNFNVGVHYNLGAKSWGLSLGYTYHFDNTFENSLTAGANLGVNFSKGTAQKSTSFDVSANLGYYALLGDMKHGVLWPKGYINYRFDSAGGEDKEVTETDDNPGAFTFRPAAHVGYRF